MLRVVLAVLLTVSLLAISIPLVERAGIQYSDQRVTTELETLETAGETLVEGNDPPPDSTQGARTELTLTMPEPRLGVAGIDQFMIANNGTVRWRTNGGSTQTRQLTAVQFQPRPDPLKLDTSGRHRLVLEVQPDESIVVHQAEV